MSKLGHLDRVEAFEFAHYLCLMGRATKPSLGWTSWFAPIEVMPNAYEFFQEPPTGAAIQVAIPLQIVGIFASTGVKEVVVRHLVNGKPTDQRVTVRPISRLEEMAISALMSPSARSHLRARRGNRLLPAVGASFTMELGNVDVPFACGTWNDPSRARRYELYLSVDALLPGPADIEMAVIDCFQCAGVSDALATLLSPAGWPATLAVFREELETRLLTRLGDKLVDVKVTTCSHCLENEAAFTSIRAPTSPPPS